MGPTKFSYIVAFIVLGGEARISELAKVVNRNTSSISGMVKKLRDDGLVERIGWGRYKIDLEGLPERIHEVRDKKQEFLRDERCKHGIQKARKRYADYAQDFVHQKGTRAEHKRRNEAFRRLIANLGKGAPNKTEDVMEPGEEINTGGRK